MTGPRGGSKTRDGVRLRAGLWHREAEAGTVLLFPGRTEYVEKYGRAARHFAARGLATMAWTGAGRALPTGSPAIRWPGM